MKFDPLPKNLMLSTVSHLKHNLCKSDLLNTQVIPESTKALIQALIAIFTLKTLLETSAHEFSQSIGANLAGERGYLHQIS